MAGSVQDKKPVDAAPPRWGVLLALLPVAALEVYLAAVVGVSAAVFGGLALLLSAAILVATFLRPPEPRMQVGDGPTRETLQELVAVSAFVSESPHTDQVHRRIVDGAEKLLKAGGAFFFSRLDGKAAFRDCEGLVWEHLGSEEVENLQDMAVKTMDNREVHFFDAGFMREHLNPPPVGSVHGLAAPLVAGEECLGAFIAIGHGGPTGSFLPIDREVAHSFALSAAVSLKNAEARELQINFYTHSVELLVLSLEGIIVPMNHLRHVAQYADTMSRQLQLDEEERRNIHFAGLLHDIGMIKIPLDLQANPEHFRLHPVLGAEMVGRVLIWKDLVPMIRYHHENFDGTGYPDRLKNVEIPLSARILSIAESFDAMTNTKTYRSAISIENAIQDLRKEAGFRYDPKLVEIFAEAVGEMDFDH